MNQNEKFIEIMKNKDYKIIAALGKYLHNSINNHYGSNPNAPPNRKGRKRWMKNPTKLASYVWTFNGFREMYKWMNETSM